MHAVCMRKVRGQIRAQLCDGSQGRHCLVLCGVEEEQHFDQVFVLLLLDCRCAVTIRESARSEHVRRYALISHKEHAR